MVMRQGAILYNDLSVRRALFPLVMLVAALLPAGQGEAAATCFGQKPTTIGTPGNDLIKTGPGFDVIVSGGGNDTIISGGGDDRICAGGGDNVISSGTGVDRILAGSGEDMVRAGDGGDKIKTSSGNDTIIGDSNSDFVQAGEGDDEIYGKSGGDELFGQGGADRIFAGTIDDFVYGGAGSDLLVGGHGIDDLYGGEGDDHLRGGLNRDGYYGGEGEDTASFAAASPPGYGSGGVKITANLAFGDDGNNEVLSSLEHYLGSAYRDSFQASGTFSDLCGGDDCNASGPVVLVDQRAAIDSGVVVLGDSSANNWQVEMISPETVSITHGGSLEAGDGCQEESAERITCSVATRISFVLLSSEAGDDRLALGSGFRDDMTSDLAGGDGNDFLQGGAGDDSLIDTGGEDRQEGGEGSDALLSAGGADKLFGGPGGDQMVTSDACAAHRFVGGGGAPDVAGFARVKTSGVAGQIGDIVRPVGQPECLGVFVSKSDEVLEGTAFSDRLLGSSGPDILYAREGDDFLRGFSGDDRLYGIDGIDTCLGDGGRNYYESCESRD